jgi:glycosyltransferase involved in cell wall biosynthesis
VAARLERALGLAHGSSAVVAPAIELDGALERKAARRALGLDEGARIALVVGRLIPGKRANEALSALRLLAIRTVVLGDGPELARLRRDFPEAEFTGTLPRARALVWIAAADVLVSASRDEGAPTAIREARALGVPVAARPAGDVARWALDDPSLVVVR